MKYLLVLLSVTVFAKGCNNKNADQETLKTAQDDISIQYEVTTRGFYQKIELTKAQFSLTNITGGKVSVQQEVSEEDWNDIVQLLDKIDAEKLKKTYVNPDDLARDAVIPGKLVIRYKENEVASVDIADGNPPAVLAPLLNKLEAMANAVDKP
ncbi:MAG: hypothetical protein AAF617_05570 [Bacteroidota bacterium]